MRVESKRRRRHRRRDHLRRMVRFGLTRVLPLLVLLVALGEAWPHLRGWLTTVEALEVQRVRVAGNRLFTPHELIEIAGIAPGTSLLEVRPSTCEERLIVHPRIRRARLQYIFPRDVRILVEEREPVALLEMDGLHPLSADGVVLPSAPGRIMESLPVVVPPRDLRWEGHLIQDENVLAGLAFLRELDHTDRRLTGSISVIDLTDARFAHVHLDTLSTALVFEIGGSWSAHVRALPAVVNDLTRSRLHGTVLDLRFREQIVRRGGTFAQLTTSAG